MTIIEDDSHVCVEDFTIPKGRGKTEIKIRENVVWAILGKWLSKNPQKRKRNIDLDDYIYLRFDGMQETVNKAARSYKSTMAVFALDFLLEHAIKVGNDKPRSKRQGKFTEMLIMNVLRCFFHISKA